MRARSRHITPLYSKLLSTADISSLCTTKVQGMHVYTGCICGCVQKLTSKQVLMWTYCHVRMLLHTAVVQGWRQGHCSDTRLLSHHRRWAFSPTQTVCALSARCWLVCADALIRRQHSSATDGPDTLPAPVGGAVLLSHATALVASMCLPAPVHCMIQFPKHCLRMERRDLAGLQLRA